ncbi:MAG: hypothetical protein HOO67_02745 [Candidatus Peribacteraceae bacterium]|nr:hypothetical protein [Candidatus Peribacteraceae bacterium]
MVYTQEHTGKKSRKKGGCRGCLKFGLWCVLIVFLLSGIAAALVFRVPQRLGILPSATKRVFTQTPDRAGAKKVLAEARAAGLNTQGISLYVFPVGDGTKSIALATIDERKGFSFGQTAGLDPMAHVMTKLMAGPTVTEIGVERVGVHYIGENGAQFGSFTASADSIRAVAAGRMTKEQFISAVDGDVNIPAMLKYQLDALTKLQ